MSEQHPDYARIDLHLHLDGSLSLFAVRTLSSMQDIPLPESDEELAAQLCVNHSCKDLNEYLSCFNLPLKLLQTADSLEFSVRNLLRELAGQGLYYAEIRFAPQLHTRKGLSQQQVIEAAIRGLKDSPIPAGLILCCMRQGDNEKENLETVSLAAEYLHKGVLALDLAGAEGLFPTEGFHSVFEKARSLQVPFTIHAGEAAGALSVEAALAFGAVRIGHGIRAKENPETVKKLAKHHIVLEMCPTSNLDTKACKNLTDYPLPYYVNQGVPVTLNTDDMTVSSTTLRQEYELMSKTFGLSDDFLKNLALTSVDAAFCDPSVKEELRRKILALSS